MLRVGLALAVETCDRVELAEPVSVGEGDEVATCVAEEPREGVDEVDGSWVGVRLGLRVWDGLRDGA